MDDQLPNPAVALPYRPFGVAMTIYLFGITVFAVCTLFLNQSGMETATVPLLRIKGRPITMAVLIEMLEMVFLIVMGITFIIQNRRAGKLSLKQAQESNTKLKTQLLNLKKRETELLDTIRDLEQFNAMTTGREQRILDLKDEVNALLQDMNQPKRYNTVPTE